MMTYAVSLIGQPRILHCSCRGSRRAVAAGKCHKQITVPPRQADYPYYDMVPVMPATGLTATHVDALFSGAGSGRDVCGEPVGRCHRSHSRIAALCKGIAARPGRGGGPGSGMSVPGDRASTAVGPDSGSTGLSIHDPAQFVRRPHRKAGERPGYRVGRTGRTETCREAVPARPYGASGSFLGARQAAGRTEGSDPVDRVGRNVVRGHGAHSQHTQRYRHVATFPRAGSAAQVDGWW